MWRLYFIGIYYKYMTIFKKYVDLDKSNKTKDEIIKANAMQNV